MPSLLHSIASRTQRFIRPETTVVDGSVLPASHLRSGGVNFASDAAFIASGEREADRLAAAFKLSPRSRILEIGCGPGRLPIGILRRIGEVAAYRGVDVSDTAIQWCKRHIERAHPSFLFFRLDARNARYNPSGRVVESDFRLPFDDAEFDVIYLYSVFSHLLQADVERYLAEFRRLLAPAGRVFLTAFIEENVEPVEENPDGYHRAWKGALHCVRYDRAFFEGLLRAHGLRLLSLEYATEADGQSGLTIALR